MKGSYRHSKTTFDLRKDILGLCQISDRGELRRRIQKLYADRTLPELEDLKNSLRRFGIRSVPSLLKLRMDRGLVTKTIGGVLAQDLVLKVDPQAIRYEMPLGIAVGAITYVRRKRQEWDRFAHDSPASLLLAVQRELAS